MIKYHPKIQEVLNFANHGTVLDGCLASEAIDSSGEILDIKGADISSLNHDGIANSEHINPDNQTFKEVKNFLESNSKNNSQWGTVVGRIIFAKKIFSESDCDSDRELKLWKKIELPFIYGAIELFDAEGHQNSMELAAIVRHYHNRALPVVTRYSIEGNTVQREGNHLVKTICRRVAVTVKPCNKSSVSSLVSEASSSSKELSKKESELSNNEMEYDSFVDVSPIEMLIEGLSDIKELTKTLELGNSSAMPNTLSQGSALAAQDMSIKKMSILKNQIRAAVRDWNKSEDFKTFLKHRLPEIDDSFIEKFTEMIDDFKFKKSEDLYQILKSSIEELYQAAPQLSDLNDKKPPGTIKFQNKYVKPGTIQIIDGPFNGSKLKMVHEDETHVYIIPFRSGASDEVKVNKLNKQLEGKHFQILSLPEKIYIPNLVHGDKHSHDLNHEFEQKELIHGIDVDSQPFFKPWTSTDARSKPGQVYGWFKNHKQDNVFVKPSVKYPQDEHGDDKALTTAKREVVFYNLAKNFFGLNNVPKAALFGHPDSEEDHSVQEIIPEANHMKRNTKDLNSNILNIENESGNLHKMAIMDSIMGNMDRNRTNYIVSSQNKIHLVDNALIFNYKDDYIPAYLTDYNKMVKQNMHETDLHLSAKEWLIKLDPFELKRQLDAYEIHPDVSSNAIKRLVTMQSDAIMGETKLDKILFSHKKFEGQV